MSSAASIWSYGQAGLLAQATPMADELHRVYGLQASAPLSADPSAQRVTGDVVQTISKTGDEVTLTRV